ncbi:O-antigen ligase family protein [Sphingomonas sp. PL20]|uniref:O-antigen ligase family protein n=1 Tax=Sphingomonas sp. PL20 TaxID=2760712 RepID=UPI001AE28CF5
MAKIDRRTRHAALPVALTVALLLSWTALPAIVGGGLWSPAVPIVAEAYALEYLKLASAAALFFAVALIGLQRGLCRSVAGWIVLFSGVLLIVTIAAWQFDFLGLWGFASDTGYHRFSATIGNPNAAGCFYGMIAIISVGYAMDRGIFRTTSARQVVVIGGALMVAAGAFVFLLLSQSRSAFLLTMLALTILVVTQVVASRARDKMGLRSWSVLIVGILALTLTLPLAAGAVLDRLSTADSDGIGRWLVWRHYSALAWNAPAYGYGLGSFFEFNQRHLDASSALDFWNFGAAHNAALQFTLEAGWPALGLLVFAGTLVTIRTVPALIIHADTLGIAIVLAICLAIGCSCVDIALNVPGIAAFTAGLAGLCWGRSLRFRTSDQRDNGLASLS